MMEFIEDAIRLVLGNYFFEDYGHIAVPLLDVLLTVFAILIVILTYKLWKYLLFGWWNK